jgi:gas vesicle protein
MSSNVSQSEIVAILVGIIIGAIVTGFGVLLQFMLTERRDKRRDKEAKQTRRAIAYAHMSESVQRIQAKSQVKAARLTEKEYERLQDLVASYYDVLDSSTITAWSAKQIIRHVYGDAFAYEIDLEQFCQDINNHITKAKKAKA